MRIRHVPGAEAFVEAHPLVVQAPQDCAGSWRTSVFGRHASAPLYLEVGMGMGRFLRESARLHPEICYIGYEINTTALYKALRRLDAEEAKLREAAGAGALDAAAQTAEAASAAPGEAGLRGNLRFIRSDARFLEEHFGEHEADRIYLNFSDPWPKDKNANKRLTSPVFLKHYERILKEDGRIEFKTDNRGLFGYSVETLPREGWHIEALTYDLHMDPVLSAGNVMTEYELKFSERGNPIFKLIASRQV